MTNQQAYYENNKATIALVLKLGQAQTEAAAAQIRKVLRTSNEECRRIYYLLLQGRWTETYRRPKTLAKIQAAAQ